MKFGVLVSEGPYTHQASDDAVRNSLKFSLEIDGFAVAAAVAHPPDHRSERDRTRRNDFDAGFVSNAFSDHEAAENFDDSAHEALGRVRAPELLTLTFVFHIWENFLSLNASAVDPKSRKFTQIHADSRRFTQRA